MVQELLSTYNAQSASNPAVYQMHTDKHSDSDLTRVENGGISHSEYDSHTDQMWG